MKDLTIIIPAHNEEENIEDMLERCKIWAPDAEVIVVCDRCTDWTRKIVDDVAEENQKVRAISIQGTRGGFKYALLRGVIGLCTKYVAICMADGCDDLSRLCTMYWTMENNHPDVVCGSRYMSRGQVIKPDSESKVWASFFVGFLSKVLVGVPTWDSTNAFRMWRNTTLRDAVYGSHRKGGFECNMEWLFRAHFKGARIVEIPTTWRGRAKGKSKFNFLGQAPAYVGVLLLGVYWRVITKLEQAWGKLGARSKGGC